MASSVKIGDTVRFLNSVGGGRVTRIEANMAFVTDEDGFDTPVLLKVCGCRQFHGMGAGAG